MRCIFLLLVKCQFEWNKNESSMIYYNKLDAFVKLGIPLGKTLTLWIFRMDT
jgi:hypothetical protein